ncbi:uncharacterized protein FIBRA_09567 [Fibroporia radiculosa]|uniref:Fe2OG dioxygenase domain-containing protein n=1 Tax=Fibroporia radiculosa TaxID=599839 RepID=J7RI27_9APHY|nr:uncharacterized protein FIBRA_09567 [Fibroporia radiculosa]CCM07222.1 predicted protein [Fibroporia radiculosa]
MPAPTTCSPADLHDPTSAAYKKARRLHLKTTRNRSDHAEADWTPFRAAEKKYKARFPPPDLSHVLDTAALDPSRSEEVSRGGWRGSGSTIVCREIELECAEGPSESTKGYVFPSTPGLVLLPSFVPHEEQRRLVRWALCDQARHPNETNLDTHYVLPEDGLWNRYLDVHRSAREDDYIQPRASSSEPGTETQCEPPGPRKLISNEAAGKDNFSALSTTSKLPPAPSPTAHPAPASTLVPKLRWANIGWSYHWGTKQYDFSRGKGAIHEEIQTVCRRAVQSIRWDEIFHGPDVDSGDWGDGGPDWDTWHETYEPDAGIVNFYQTKDTLMAHVDRSEVCATSPLVSISLGCAAIFLIGGLTRDVEPTAILLRSGDVVIMSGPACRRAYHGVPRILEGTLPPHLEAGVDAGWQLYEEYLHSARINVNVRQVFPRGFVPSEVGQSAQGKPTRTDVQFA